MVRRPAEACEQRHHDRDYQDEPEKRRDGNAAGDGQDEKHEHENPEKRHTGRPLFEFHRSARKRRSRRNGFSTSADSGITRTGVKWTPPSRPVVPSAGDEKT